VVKRQNEGVALGFVTARVLEADMIFTGVVSLLSLVTLRQHLSAAGGANAAALITTGASHVAVYKLDVPARAEPHASHQRTAAGLPAATDGGNVAAQGRSVGGRRPHTPMWTNPHAKKSASPGRSMSAVACARLSAPTCTFGRARAAWLS
jgi:hypothetical protein